jgi:hypothetical protein
MRCTKPSTPCCPSIHSSCFGPTQRSYIVLAFCVKAQSGPFAAGGRLTHAWVSMTEPQRHTGVDAGSLRRVSSVRRSNTSYSAPLETSRIRSRSRRNGPGGWRRGASASRDLEPRVSGCSR